MEITKTFTQWLSESEVEADLRSHVQYLHIKSKGRRYGLESGDLFHDVFVKLSRHEYPIPSRGKLFSLVRTTALNHLMDQSRKYSFRSAFFTKPMPTRLRPQPGSSIETVAWKGKSPAIQAALNDEVESIRSASEEDPKLKGLFQAIEELTGKGESVSATNVAAHLNLPYKQVTRTIQELRATARRHI